MEIEEVGKAFNTKKLKKYYPVLIVIVALVGLYVYYKNKSSPSTLTTSADQTNLGNNQDLSAITDQLNTQINTQMQQLQSQVQSVVTEQQNYEQTMTANLENLGSALNKQQQEQYKALETQLNSNMSDITNKVTSQLNQTLQNSLNSITGQSVINHYTNTQPTVTNTQPTVTNTQSTVNPLQNEITYLENMRQTGSQGQKAWANQTEYLLNLATQSSDQGTKKWAINQLTTKQGVTPQQLQKLGVK